MKRDLSIGLGIAQTAVIITLISCILNKLNLFLAPRSRAEQ